MMHAGRGCQVIFGGDTWDGARNGRTSLVCGRGSSADGAACNYDMDLVEYFERQRQRCERELKYAGASGLQLFERTPQGEQDITEQHVQQLREAREEYQRMIEYLKARN